ncbi:hypothetical protein [Pseudonocardia acidicola]|uniref:Uncharacterized protein n=1 Tax=Pseudonocardia acidicola TaxID=2724939 RepID=A0ABX1S7N4_9PSEU|nr:hypothetical protein [Pseudonocardia acidicola]NMH97570.1 hypothetical protein [Pseudonocardia acidicola]
MSASRYDVTPIGWVDSPLVDRDTAPKQGDGGAPDAWPVLNGPHRMQILSVAGDRVRVRDLEAHDGIPIVDVEPVLEPTGRR